MERIDTIIIVAVVVVFPFCLLCRDAVDRQMVLRASESSVLCDCPKIRFCNFRDITTQTDDTNDIKKDDDLDEDEDKLWAGTGTDIISEPRSFMPSNGVA